MFFLRTGYDFVSVSAIGRRREADPLGQDKRREGGEGLKSPPISNFDANVD